MRTIMFLLVLYISLQRVGSLPGIKSSFHTKCVFWTEQFNKKTSSMKVILLGANVALVNGVVNDET